MMTPILIGIAAGFAMSVLVASAGMGSFGGRFLLHFLAPLPAFLAGLGWGPVAALACALSAMLGATLVLSAKMGLVVLLSQGLPVALLCYLAQLNREATVQGPTGQPVAATEWYPVGRLVAVAAAVSGALAFASLYVLGQDIDELRKLLRKLIEEVFLKQLPGLKERTLSESEIATLTEMALYAFPAASALSWLGGFLLNFYLAGRITLGSGRLLRPWPDIPAMTFPRGFGMGLALALAGAVGLTGYPALAASGFAGAFFLAFVFMGLAVIHHASRGKAMRPVLLAGLYLGVVILNTWAGLLLALLGILAPLLPLRRSQGPGPGPLPPAPRPGPE